MANTGNPETDKLELVNIEVVEKRLLKRNISFREGFSQEIFRSGEYIGAVLQPGVVLHGDLSKQSLTLPVGSGDTIVHVNLGVQTLAWSDVLVTSDGYTRNYQVELRIQVIEPLCFALRCLQRSDPVRLALRAIHEAFTSYAVRYEHDGIDPTYLRYLAQNTLRESYAGRMDDNRVAGLKVISAILQCAIDPKRAALLEAAQQAHIKQEELDYRELLAAQRERELRIEKQVKTSEIWSEAEIQKVEIQTKEDVQKINDDIAKLRRIRQARAEIEEDALKKQYELEKEARLREFERQEEEKRKRSLREEQQKQEEFERQLEKQRKQHTRIEMEQDQIFEIEFGEHKLLGEGKLDAMRRQQASEKNEYARYEESLQNRHKRSEDLKQFEHEWQKKDKNVYHEQKNAFFSQVVESIREQLALEIANGASLNDVDDIMQIIEKMQYSGKSLPGSPRMKITQGDQERALTKSPAYRALEDDQQDQYEEGPFEEVGLQKVNTIYIPSMGLSLIPANLSKRQCARAELDTDIVFLIWKLYKDSPAARVQIQVGDMLISINQTRLRSLQVLSDVLQECADDTILTLNILRGGNRFDKQVETDK